MKKPIIGITLDYEKKGGYSKFPWYAIRYNYLHIIEKYGGIPFPLFHSNKNIDDLFNFVDGLIITGGNFDIDPKFFGNKISGARKIKNQRTIFEMNICKKFLDSSKPILGICGGEQLLNVVCGGSLILDIKQNPSFPINHEQPNPRNQTSHNVEIVNNTLLKKIINKKIIKVNSAHHQAVNKIGENLIVNSYAPDGIIESIEHKFHKWCLGVQWHPEFLITNEDKKLIKHFLNSACS
tara:strand:- start:1826 stop:2536 length:711 start_codon:yes stop_codon:yes gene_type:complete